MAKTKKKSSRSASGSKTATRKRSGAGRADGSNGKKLVVVESPAKARTINRYLGSDFVVKASMGHVRDLPGKDIGVDLENDFSPTYEPLPDKKKVLAELRKLAKGAPEVFLATDLDREGEAIAWHLAESLGVEPDRIRRVIFNEITSSAIREAFAAPRTIDMDKVNAQQTRRILDRIVGYRVSPLLWRKVATGLSAGRVQSVAVRLIVEREREIEAFDPEEYWKIGAIFSADPAAADELARAWRTFLTTEDEKDGSTPNRDQQQTFIEHHGAFQAELVSLSGKKFRSDDGDETIRVARSLGLDVEEIQRREDPKGKGVARNVVRVVGLPSADRPPYHIRGLKQRQSRSRPYAPFTTAALQQSAAVKLRFRAQQTMRIAQQLYEGVEVPGEGSVGLITYMRTDSTHLSKDSIEQVRSYIRDRFGEEYVPEKPNRYAAGQRAQEAHEAIRPTDVRRHPSDLRGVLNAEQHKLYTLIWQRFVSCQMPPAVWNVTEVDIVTRCDAGEAVFKAVGRTMAFDGYLRVADKPRTGGQILPPLDEGQEVGPVEIDPTQHFTQPPPRYTEASLVKALEADGIGRPSTYATIIQTIQNREYVKQVDRTFRPTHLGVVVTDKLVSAFEHLFDVRFTAEMEDKLDEIEEQHADWVRILRDFYGPFDEQLQQAQEKMVHAKAETQPSDYNCPTCGKEMVYRFSKSGRYLACTGYPDCRETFPVDEDGNKIEALTVDVACPLCGEPMVQRRGRFGPFLSCRNYPACKGVVNLDRKGRMKLPSAPPLLTDVPCPKCEEGTMNLRRSRRGPWLSCARFPKCRGRVGFKSLDEDKQKQLEDMLVAHEQANPVPTLRHLDGREVALDTTPRVLSAEEVADLPAPASASETDEKAS